MKEEDAVLRREGWQRGGLGDAKVEDGTKTYVCSLTSLADRWQRLRPIPSDSVCVLSSDDGEQLRSRYRLPLSPSVYVSVRVM